MDGGGDPALEADLEDRDGHFGGEVGGVLADAAPAQRRRQCCRQRRQLDELALLELRVRRNYFVALAGKGPAFLYEDTACHDTGHGGLDGRHVRGGVRHRRDEELLQQGGAGEFRVVSPDVAPAADGSGRLRMYFECCPSAGTEPSVLRSAVSTDGGLVWSVEPGVRFGAPGRSFMSARIVLLEDGRCRLYSGERGRGIVSALSTDGGLTFVEEAGLQVPVEPLATSDYPTAAPRPAYSVLANHAWAALGEASLPAWRAGLHAYLAERRSTASMSAGG